MSWYNPMSWGEGERVDLPSNLGELPHAETLWDLNRRGLAEVNRRGTPQAQRTTLGRVSQYGGQGQFRDRMGAFADRLGQIASGQQAGAGELAARRNATRAIAQQQAMARMNRGAGAALAARSAARNTGDIGLAAAGQAQQAAMQDQQASFGLLGQTLGQGAAQDVQVGLANMDAKNQAIFQQAGLDQATSLANMQARLSKMGMDDAASLAYLGQLLGISQAELQGRLQAEGLKIGNYKPGIGGDLLAAGGTLGAAAITKSDRRSKKDVRKVGKSIDEMLDKLQSYAYRYKNEKDGEGRRAGIMAQDLEASEAGKRVVRDTPDGKVLDVNAALSAAMASVARLNKRLRVVEAEK